MKTNTNLTYVRCWMAQDTVESLTKRGIYHLAKFEQFLEQNRLMLDHNRQMLEQNQQLHGQIRQMFEQSQQMMQAFMQRESEAARKLREKAFFGAIDCTSENGGALCGQYGVHSYPSLKGFGRNKKKPHSYEGPRDAKGLVHYGNSACKRGLCKKKRSGKKTKKETLR